MLKVVVVEDEVRIRDAIVNIINQQCNSLEVVRIADDLHSAYNEIKLCKPDIVALDVELSNGNAFDLLKKFDEINFKIIFITAYEGYALQAIKLSAFNYILKPFSSEELVNVFNNAAEIINRSKTQASFETLLEHIDNKGDKKIVLKTQSEIHIVPIKDIVHCEADSSYTHFKMKDGLKYTVSGNLKSFELLLTPHKFVRVHHSHLVNLNEIKTLFKTSPSYLIMTDGSNISVSSRRKEYLIKELNSL